MATGRPYSVRTRCVYGGAQASASRMVLNRAQLACLLAFLLTAQVSFQLTVGAAQSAQSIKIGAWGDDASRENLGVSAAIQTNAYESYPGSFDYFWVGNNLADGGFIQFGYGVEPGLFCLQGSRVGGKPTCSGITDLILDDDARWEWQYWPKREGTDHYYGIGPAHSVGANGTWHSYAIAANAQNTWSFYLDDQPVANLSIPVTASVDPALMVAEKTIDNSSSNLRLGPVEFANLSYYHASDWHQMDSLVAIRDCSANLSCSNNGVGEAMLGENHAILGSGLPITTDGSLLWTRSYVRLTVDAGFGSRFYITSLSTSSTFEGNAEVSLPRRMFVYVSQSDTTVQQPGILGVLGGSEKFAGWTGDVTSANATIQIFLDTDTHINANWIADDTQPILVLLILCIMLTLSVVLALKRRSGNPVTL
jgi:hypothetical protein